VSTPKSSCGARARQFELDPRNLVPVSEEFLVWGAKAQKNDSLPGSLDMLVLRTLSLRDIYGYGIVQFIQQSSAPVSGGTKAQLPR
jgi:hypothetical protein